MIRGSVETRFSEKYPPCVYTVFLNNTVTRVGYFSRYAAKTDGMMLCGKQTHSTTIRSLIGNPVQGR